MLEAYVYSIIMLCCFLICKYSRVLNHRAVHYGSRNLLLHCMILRTNKIHKNSNTQQYTFVALHSRQHCTGQKHTEVMNICLASGQTQPPPPSLYPLTDREITKGSFMNAFITSLTILLTKQLDEGIYLQIYMSS